MRCQAEAEGAASAAAKEPFAKMVSLTCTARVTGSVLGCFTLDLPRTRDEPMAARPNLRLPCHAFGDKLVLAGLPGDLDEAELMKFFSKQGASSAIVAHARTCSFASVSFSSFGEIAKFLARTAHAYADEKGTLIARLLPLEAPDMATLPALPAPSLTSNLPEEAEPGSLMVYWSPLVLAVAYSVELRVAGSTAPWSSVDVASKRLEVATTNRFDSNCSSCKVTGLQLTAAYEARVSYFTECGTMSESSEASEPCVPSQGASKDAKPPAHSPKLPPASLSEAYPKPFSHPSHPSHSSHSSHPSHPSHPLSSHPSHPSHLMPAHVPPPTSPWPWTPPGDVYPPAADVLGRLFVYLCPTLKHVFVSSNFSFHDSSVVRLQSAYLALAQWLGGASTCRA